MNKVSVKMWAAFVLVQLLSGPVQAQDIHCSASDDRVRVAALYSKDWKGRAFLTGVEQAFGERGTACIELHSYRGDTEGETMLVKLIEGGAVDIVLGPDVRRSCPLDSGLR